MVQINGENWYSLKEASEKLHISYHAMQAWVKRHRSEVKVVRIGRNVMVRLADLKSHERKTTRAR
jgi:hypothetical protein